MNCKKVQPLLPLVIGSELSQSKILAIKSHLRKCSKCQQEYDSYILSLEKTKEWLAKDKRDWEDWEWLRAIQNALKKEPSGVSSLTPWPFKKSWAYALMAVLAIALTLFVVRPYFIREEIASESKMITESQRQPSVSFFDKSQQEIISMTIVSKETGLKIAWFLNKNFELKEKK